CERKTTATSFAGSCPSGSGWYSTSAPLPLGICANEAMSNSSPAYVKRSLAGRFQVLAKIPRDTSSSELPVAGWAPKIHTPYSRWSGPPRHTPPHILQQHTLGRSDTLGLGGPRRQR